MNWRFLNSLARPHPNHSPSFSHVLASSQATNHHSFRRFLQPLHSLLPVGGLDSPKCLTRQGQTLWVSTTRITAEFLRSRDASPNQFLQRVTEADWVGRHRSSNRHVGRSTSVALIYVDMVCEHRKRAGERPEPRFSQTLLVPRRTG